MLPENFNTEQFDLATINEDDELKRLYKNMLKWKIKVMTDNFKDEFASRKEIKKVVKEEKSTW